MERKRFSIWLIMAHLFALMCFVTGVVLTVHGTAQGAAEWGENMVIERWGIFEIELKGPYAGNPFLDVELSAQFKHGVHTVEVDGFYDGDGIYKIRFMPDKLGKWSYATESNRPELDDKTGEFNCVKPSSRNHGPVGIHNTYYFDYADGTTYLQIGTTSYAWVHQEEELQEQTLETLRQSPFNKLRMCVFPKDYVYNKNEPPYYPFEGKPLKDWDFTRFNPEFFRHFEKRVKDLMNLGIEADIILFHPYDRWGFKEMGFENNIRYLRYVVARLAAFRNVWWSLANEYDFLGWTKEEWDKYFQFIRDNDPYNHPRSIHNGRKWYDHSKPWAPKEGYALRLTSYAPGEKMRPEIKASAEPSGGIVPLSVRFSASDGFRYEWEFGDGSRSSAQNPTHVYEKHGLYTVKLTGADESGVSVAAFLPITVDRDPKSPLIRVGFKENESPGVTLHGQIIRYEDGSYDLGEGEPWKWISVGKKPIEALEGLVSFTIMGWLNPSSLETGSGGNRIVFNLNRRRSGFDLVCLSDGRLRLAINEWPDRIDNDSPPGKIKVNRWTFFAVTYDGTKRENNVHWYFGDEENPAELEQVTSYWRGRTGKDSGVLTIGNYNETMHRYGLDRQFRGQIRGIEIFGNFFISAGALSLDEIRKHQ